MLFETLINTNIFIIKARRKLISNFCEKLFDLSAMILKYTAFFVQLELKFALSLPLKLFYVEASVLICIFGDFY